MQTRRLATSFEPLNSSLPLTAPELRTCTATCNPVVLVWKSPKPAGHQCVKKNEPKHFWNFAVETSTNCNSYISEYCHSIFCNKAQGSMLNQIKQKVFTGDLWTLVNCCDRATYFSNAFKHNDTGNITQKVQLLLTLYFIQGTCVKLVAHGSNVARHIFVCGP